MKRHKSKLTLSNETIRTLSRDELISVAAGNGLEPAASAGAACTKTCSSPCC